MKTMKHVALVAVLGIAVAVVLGTPAPATAGWKRPVNVKLYPPADGPFPAARGTMTLYPSSRPPAVGGVTVSVSKLAPNTWYVMPVYIRYSYWDSYWGWLVYWEGWSGVSIQTDANGNGRGSISADECHPEGNVYDSSTGTLVLTSNP